MLPTQNGDRPYDPDKRLDATQRDELVNHIVDLRIKEQWATKSILDFLMKEKGFSKDWAYEYIRRAKALVSEIYKDQLQGSLEDAIAQLEHQQEDAKKNKQYKLAYNIRQEISKLKGLVVNKTDITSGGQPLEFRIEIVYPKSNEDNKGN